MDTTRPPLRIERVPTDALTLHPRNVREGDVGAIAASLSRPEGQYRPIVVQRMTPDGETRMVVLAGNHTLMAARSLGWEDIDAVLLDVSDEAGLAIMLRDNRTHDLGRDDPMALFELLRELDAAGGLDATAYDREDLDTLLRDLERDGEDPMGRKGAVPRPDVDADAPEPAPKPWVKRGDVFRLGEHRVMCGDSSDPRDVARLIGDRRPTLMATDPPYGIGYAAVVDGRANQKDGGWEDIRNDGDEAGAAALAGRVVAAFAPYAGPGCALLLWVPPGSAQGLFRSALVAAGMHVLKVIVWVKPTLVFGRHEYHWRHETALYGWLDGNRAAFHGPRSETTVWEVDYSEGYKVRNGPAMASGGLGLHPTQKPVELTARPVRNHTRLGEYVYEPFVGSGSGLIACEAEGRRCLAMDLDPGYAQVTIERWERHTGRKAEREEDPTT